MFRLPTHISRYEIKGLIGRGGMGDLYLARDTNPNTNRLVAIKLLNASLDSGDLRERFARESRAMASLNHPNIVNIYDSGEFEDSPFIVPACVCVSRSSSATRAMPKSRIFTVPWYEIIRFDGEMSRWMIPSGCPVADFNECA